MSPKGPWSMVLLYFTWYICTSPLCCLCQTAYSQIALAFRCDQYTLKQRLQAEEHSRNLAEENIQLELSRGRETLEVAEGRP